MNTATNILNGSNDSAHAGTDAAARMAHDLVDRAARHLASSEEKVRHTTHDATHKVKDSLQTVANRSLQAGASARSLLARHPLATLGAAICIGASAAYFVLRPRTGNPVASTTPQGHAE